MLPAIINYNYIPIMKMKKVINLKIIVCYRKFFFFIIYNYVKKYF